MRARRCTVVRPATRTIAGVRVGSACRAASSARLAGIRRSLLRTAAAGNRSATARASFRVAR